MHFVIATHGELAEGLYQANSILCGKNENVTVLKAYVASDNFEEEFAQTLAGIADENVIVLTDLLGGSVNQVVMKQSMARNLKIITGVNLACVLRVLAIKDTENLEDQLRDCVEQSRGQLIFINRLIETVKKEEV